MISVTGWLGEAASAAYIAVIALVAQSTGVAYVLFPDFGALAHDIFKRPRGTWARAPLMLVVTPLLTALIGTMIARHLPYGLVSILLAVGSAVLIIAALKSPIAPAISAGLLPLTLDITSWWYPLSLNVGTGLLASASLIWVRIAPRPAATVSVNTLADDVVEEAPSDYTWVPFFLVFLLGERVVESNGTRADRQRSRRSSFNVRVRQASASRSSWA